MTPSFALADARSGGNGHAENPGSVSVCPRQSAHSDNLGFGEFRVSVPRTTGNRAVASSVSAIRSGVPIIEVISAIVQRISIFVANHWATVRRWANEGFRDQPVDAAASRLSIQANRHLSATSGADGLRQNLGVSATTIRHNASYAAKARGCIFGRARNYQPAFTFHGVDDARNAIAEQGVMA